MDLPKQNDLRICQLNCENLFLHMDFWKGQDVQSLNEKERQALAAPPTDNKPRTKIKDLAEAILDINADIFMLNEVGGRKSLDQFNRHFLNSSYQPYLLEGNSDRGIDIGYLVS